MPKYHVIALLPACEPTTRHHAIVEAPNQRRAHVVARRAIGLPPYIETHVRDAADTEAVRVWREPVEAK